MDVALVLAVANDLFFADRIGGALRQLGHQGLVVDLSSDSIPALPSETGLVIADLEAGEPVLELIRAAHRAGVPTLAFGPHTDLALRAQARAAGVSRVVAKSKLTASFAELVSEMLTNSR